MTPRTTALVLAVHSAEAQPADLVAEARSALERLDALPEDLPEPYVTLTTTRDDGWGASLQAEPMPDDADAIALLAEAATGPCAALSLTDYEVGEDDPEDLDRDGMVTLLTKECRVEEDTIAGVIAVLPGKDDLPDLAAPPDAIEVELKADGESCQCSIEAHVRGGLEGERAEAAAQIAALADEAEMNSVLLRSLEVSDRITFTADVSAERVDVAEDMVAALRPLDLEIAEVILYDIDGGSGDSEPLVDLDG